MNYIGIDYHKQYSHMTLLDEDGEILRAGMVLNCRDEVGRFLQATDEKRNLFF